MRLPEIRFPPAGHGIEDPVTNAHSIIKYYDKINNSHVAGGIDALCIEEFVAAHLGSLGIKPSSSSASTEPGTRPCPRKSFEGYHYDIVIRFMVRDRNSGEKLRVRVEIEMLSLISRSSELLNAIEDVIIYQFSKLDEVSNKISRMVIEIE